MAKSHLSNLLQSAERKHFEVRAVASCISKDQMTGWWRGLSCECLDYISPGHRRLFLVRSLELWACERWKSIRSSQQTGILQMWFVWGAAIWTCTCWKQHCSSLVVVKVYSLLKSILLILQKQHYKMLKKYVLVVAAVKFYSTTFTFRWWMYHPLLCLLQAFLFFFNLHTFVVSSLRACSCQYF